MDTRQLDSCSEQVQMDPGKPPPYLRKRIHPGEKCPIGGLDVQSRHKTFKTLPVEMCLEPGRRNIYEFERTCFIPSPVMIHLLSTNRTTAVKKDLELICGHFYYPFLVHYHFSHSYIFANP